MFAAIGLITVVGIVLINEGQRRIPVHHAKRVRSGRMYGGNTTFIPLKVNSAGMIPLIFAVSILVFPGLIAQFPGRPPAMRRCRNFAGETLAVHEPEHAPVQHPLLLSGRGVHLLLHHGDFSAAEDLRESCSGRVRSFRACARAENTQQYLQRTLNRITLVGALFLGTVAILPFIAAQLTGVNSLLLGATSLLIVVGVAIDTMRQLEAQLVMRNYEGFIK